MALYRSPQGERLDIPAKGVRAIRALGWVPVDSSPASTEEQAPEGGVEPVEPKGNASREAWAQYADAKGVAYSPDATRNEIRDAVHAAAN